ncbi:MAG: cytochrome c3 family protein, partial [bacterium]|nr:cytochrome c3 family protein [bacterium]
RDECMQCHHQAQERPCLTCHSLENQFRQGVANPDVPGEPDVMADMVACDDCHAAIGEGHKTEAVLETCGACHDEGTSLAVVEAQDGAKSGIAELEELLPEARAKAKIVANTFQAKASVLVARAEKSLETLKEDRSRGFHNAAYTALLIEDARNALERVISWQETGEAAEVK